ncbi:MAG TPA: T9SS type A sorting domain-containing protein [Chitinophagales bacterium]|nr:T9SS type A sorting domain-containing protein [Chitinophagales bacterium]
MKKVRNLLLFIVCTCCANILHAQTALRIEIHSNSPDGTTIEMGDTFSFAIRIINVDTGNYTGIVSLAYSIDDGQDSLTYMGSTGTSDSSGLYFFEGNTSIPSGDTIIRSISGTVGPPRFKTGPSVVVIWPIATNNGYAINNMSFSIDIVDPLNIGRLAQGRIRVYTGNGNMQIERDEEIAIKRVRIYDILGRQLLDAPNPANSIPLPVSGPGIYVAEIIYNNNQRQTFRFYR